MSGRRLLHLIGSATELARLRGAAVAVGPDTLVLPTTPDDVDATYADLVAATPR